MFGIERVAELVHRFLEQARPEEGSLRMSVWDDNSSRTILPFSRTRKPSLPDAASRWTSMNFMGSFSCHAMPPLAQDIRSAREAVERLLEELGVRAFLYTIEQKEAGWVLSVDCAIDGGWQTTALKVDMAELNASLRDAAVRAKLRADWEPHLRACAGLRKAPRRAPRGG